MDYFNEAAAASLLERGAKWFDDTAALDHACRAAPDPDRALEALVDAALARGRTSGKARPWNSPDWIQAGAALAGASRRFAHVLVRRPRLLEAIVRNPFLDRPKQRLHHDEDLRRQCVAIGGSDIDVEPRLMRIVRRYRRSEYWRIVLRDLQGRGRLMELTAELSDLAAATLECALGVLYPRLVRQYGSPPGAHSSGSASPGFAVIAMGKLGGGELNFSSDIDLLYVYAADGDTEGGASGTTTAFEFHARLAEKLSRTLSEQTEHGFAFRVDLDLRPEGRSGPIVNSLRAFETYYETFGRTWERQALIKARPVAGDAGVAEEALARVLPFVYRRHLDLDAIKQVVSLKDELDREVRARGHAESDLKLGRGGIRSVEFLVQSIQLLHGGKDAQLRERNTLRALDRLLFAGLIDEGHVRDLTDAYVFLRRAEHRLQFVDDRQTHRLPADDRPAIALARAMGFHGEHSREEFESSLASHRENVARAVRDRFGAMDESPAIPREVRQLIDPDLTSDEAETLLDAAGFVDPPAAAAHLRRMQRRPLSPFGHTASEDGRVLGPILFAELMRSPDPDQALRHLAAYLEVLPAVSAEGTHNLLLENPAARRLLVSLFGTSDFLSQYFLRHPELLDLLLLRSAALLRRSATGFRELVTSRIDALRDTEEVLVELRRVRHEEVLRIGLNDVSGALDVIDVMSQLSSLAESLLEACLDLAGRWARRRWGWPTGEAGDEIPVTILALGKLGGAEMGYGSDLDLVFLYGGAGRCPGGERASIGAAEFFARLGQKLISYLTLPLAEGILYSTDTRLRPSGRQGSLVTTLSAFETYHSERAATWERQALTRARALGGKDWFRAAATAVVERAVYPEGPVDPERIRADIASMREKVEGERSGSGLDLKVGRGGLVDIEFVVQYLQLVHGPADPGCRSRNTLAALDALLAAGHLDEQAATTMQEAYVFLRRLGNRLRIVHDRPIEHFSARGRDLDALARRIGYHTGEGPGGSDSPAEALLSDYRRNTEQVRTIYDRVFEEGNS